MKPTLRIATIPSLLLALAAACGRPELRHTIEDAPPGAWEQGEELFGELRCVACHATDGPRTVERHDAPRLDGIGARTRASWLRAYLAEPQAAKPGTRMPDALAGLSEARRAEAVEDLVHYLATRGGPFHADDEPAAAQVVEEGRQLYHGIGCVACHDPFEYAEDLEDPLWTFEGGLAEGIEPLPSSEGSLLHVSDKTTPSELARFLLDPLAARPDGTMPGMRLSAGEAHALAAYLCADEVHEGRVDFVQAPGLFYEYFEGEMYTPEAFDALLPVRTGVVTDLSELPEHREEHFGFRFTGFLDVPADGTWTLCLSSDDGSRLYLDGEVAVDHWGDHGRVELCVDVELERGKHALSLLYYERTGFDGLSASWAPADRPDDEEPEVIGGDALAHLAAPPVDPETFVADPKRAAAGERRFTELGCAACHEPSRAPRRGPAPLDRLRPFARGGCLDPEDVDRGVPSYALTHDERVALATYVDDPQRVSAARSDAERLRHTLARLDCAACHERGDEGGPRADRRAYFRAAGTADLGNEGRFPPSLDLVGGKLTLEWMERVLIQEASARPYVMTRMPSFGAANVAQLAALFEVVDAPPNVEPVTFTMNDVEDGRRLAGVGALGCVQCHDFGPHPSTGISAVDLTTMHERIEPEWFRRLMLDPESVGMSSRMPRFWQDGLSPVRDVLDGDPLRQSDALWAWLALGNAAPLPDGLVVPDAEYELIPADGPITAMVFMQGLSARTLVVGFPERVHFAFDVENSRLAKVWRGPFFNMRGTWHGRAGQFQLPPSEDLVELPLGVPLAVLESDDAPWPTERADELGYRVLGRRVDDHGGPTFRYSVAGVVVEDTPRPVLDERGGRLRRTLALSGVGQRVDLRAAVGLSLERAGDGAWLVDGVTYAIDAPGAKLWTRRSGGREELLVRPAAGASTITIEVAW